MAFEETSLRRLINIETLARRGFDVWSQSFGVSETSLKKTTQGFVHVAIYLPFRSVGPSFVGWPQTLCLVAFFLFHTYQKEAIFISAIYSEMMIEKMKKWIINLEWIFFFLKKSLLANLWQWTDKGIRAPANETLRFHFYAVSKCKIYKLSHWYVCIKSEN